MAIRYRNIKIKRMDGQSVLITGGLGFIEVGIGTLASANRDCEA
jgi:hypothetical protein